jgi:hypothetical protein
MFHFRRYGESFPISAEVLDSSFTVPIGKAKVCSKFSGREPLNFVWYFFMDFQEGLLSFGSYWSADRTRRKRYYNYCILQDGWVRASGNVD